MESLTRIKLSLANTSQIPWITLDYKWKIQSGVSNRNKCDLLEKHLVMQAGEHLSFSIHDMLCTSYVQVANSL